MKKLRLLTAIVTCTVLVSQPAFAILPSDDIIDFYGQNGIYYYNPNGSDDCNSNATKLQGKDTAEKIWNFFYDKGFTALLMRKLPAFSATLKPKPTSARPAQATQTTGVSSNGAVAAKLRSSKRFAKLVSLNTPKANTGPRVPRKIFHKTTTIASSLSS